MRIDVARIFFATVSLGPELNHLRRRSVVGQRFVSDFKRLGRLSVQIECCCGVHVLVDVLSGDFRVVSRIVYNTSGLEALA